MIFSANFVVLYVHVARRKQVLDDVIGLVGHHTCRLAERSCCQSPATDRVISSCYVEEAVGYVYLYT